MLRPEGPVHADTVRVYQVSTVPVISSILDVQAVARCVVPAWFLAPRPDVAPLFLATLSVRIVRLLIVAVAVPR